MSLTLRTFALVVARRGWRATTAIDAWRLVTRIHDLTTSRTRIASETVAYVDEIAQIIAHTIRAWIRIARAQHRLAISTRIA